MTDRYFRQSAIKAWKNCPRSAWLQYMFNGTGLAEARFEDGPASGQRDVGTLFHLGAQAIHEGNDWVKVIDDAEAVQVVLGWTKEWVTVYKMVRIMVAGYVEWLADEGFAARERTVAVEQQFVAHAGTYLGDDVYVTGKMDRLAEDTETGLITVEDFKTVSSLEVPATLSFDDQSLTYDWILEKNGIKAHRFRHTQAKKVMQTKEGPFYARHEVTYSEDQRAVHRRHLGSTLLQIVGALQAIEANQDAHHDVTPPNPTRDCSWRCDFIHVCPMMDQGDHWETAISEWFQERVDS